METLTTIYFYRASVNGSCCEFENIYVYIPKIMIFMLYEIYFYCKNILDTYILRNLVTSINIFTCLPLY